MRGVMQNAKFMRYRILSLIASIVLIVCCSDCKRCHDKYLGSFTVTDNERQMIPYTKQSKLKFNKSTGDSIIFIIDTIKSIHSSSYKLQNYDNYEGCSDSYDCNDYYVGLIDSINSDKIEVILTYFLALELQMFIDVQLTLNDSTFYFTEFLHPLNDSLPGKYYTTLQIGPKTFSFVHVFDGSYQPSYQYRYIQSIFYTKQKVIVGIKTYSGDILYLGN